MHLGGQNARPASPSSGRDAGKSVQAGWASHRAVRPRRLRWQVLLVPPKADRWTMKCNAPQPRAATRIVFHLRDDSALDLDLSPGLYPNLPPVHQHPEISGLRRCQRMGLLFRGSSRRIKIRSRKKNIVSLRINLARFSAILRFYRFHLAEFVR